jgi:diadenosine tetraphosphate (Ap4A) HIT family hydrolase
MPPKLPAFQLDPRLDADTLLICELKLSSLRLLNDSRWPWLVLAPRIEGACELHDLSEEQQAALIGEAALAGRVLKAMTGAEKINTAAIGNIVRQLHVHVIARSQGDANWPGPVWGFGAKVAYTEDAAAALIARLAREFEKVAR